MEAYNDPTCAIPSDGCKKSCCDAATKGGGFDLFFKPRVFSESG